MVQVISNTTRPPEPVDQLARRRTEEFRVTRDEGIAAGVEYTFSDGTTAIIPTAVPDQSSRMGNLAFGEARELVADGNGSTTLHPVTAEPLDELLGQQYVFAAAFEQCEAIGVGRSHGRQGTPGSRMNFLRNRRQGWFRRARARLYSSARAR